MGSTIWQIISSSLCTLSIRMRVTIQARKPLFGTCIKKGVGTSSLLVIASESNMKVNLEVVEDKLACCFTIHYSLVSREWQIENLSRISLDHSTVLCCV